MTVNSGEGTESQGHPAWQEILDVFNELPDELKTLHEPKVREVLKKWDEGVQGKLQEARSEFDVYKPLLENNVPMESVQQALWLAQQFETNPEAVVKQAIEAFKLEGYTQTPVSPSKPEEEEEEEFEYEDDPLAGLENHPAYQRLKATADELQAKLAEQNESREEADAATQLEQYLSGLHETHGEFNDYFVTALLANGVEAEEAIETYQSTVKADAEKLAGTLAPNSTQTPPVVLGGAGTTGSGVPEEPVKLGAMKRGQVNDLVTAYLEQAARSESAD